MNIHPGIILRDDFLEPSSLTSEALSDRIGIPKNKILQILEGRCPICADIAIRLSRFFGVSPELWMDLQRDYDLREWEVKNAKEYERIRAL